MISLARDVQECTLPSWKIEPKYSTNVLIGNWVEERRRFGCNKEGTGQSTYKQGFVHFPTGTPDRTVMRRLMKQLDGLPRKYILTHPEQAKHHHLVSQYDDQYNRRGYNPRLPPLRKWHGHKMAWSPEKSDCPPVEPPTNYGLLEHLMKKWCHKEPAVMSSTYDVSYQKPPTSAYIPRQRPDTKRILESRKQWLPRSLDVPA
ncbi:cilia- and flagella-associated protein 107 [Candoia aspera]|uniref:cilia- and flagella-associated protein 107 n=1 Tax=Candoia aspera TaxID=51853 RepID=UPI002FD86B61